MGIWVNYDENKFNSPYRKWDLFTENIKRGYVEKYMNSKDYSDYSIPSTDIMMGLKDIEEVRLKVRWC